jgi:hypothetical protein
VFAEGDKGRGAGVARFPREEMDALAAESRVGNEAPSCKASEE